jgi:hypothetical protein
MNPNSSKPLPLPVIQTPFCGELRSKKFYMRDQLAAYEEDYLDSFGHTWCYHTQMPIGPDGCRAEPAACKPGRACYRSAVDEPENFLVVQSRFLKTQNPEV